jgi:hypothetical protein
LLGSSDGLAATGNRIADRRRSTAFCTQTDGSRRWYFRIAKSTKLQISMVFASDYVAIGGVYPQQPIEKRTNPRIMFEYQMVMDKIEQVRGCLLSGNAPPSI